MITFKDFDNEQEARRFRDSQRDAGFASSIFTYGKDRYRIKVIECKNKDDQQKTQYWLTRSAVDLSDDVENLTKVKEIISSQKFIDCDYESVVFVAKFLNKERWFATPNAVLEFFDFPDKQLDKIKEMVDTALNEHDEDWNDKRELRK
jgi:hypothetical protein